MGLQKFIDTETTTETVQLFQVEYVEEYGEPIIHCFCRLKDGTKRWIEIEGHRPSFFIRTEDFTSQIKNHDWVIAVDHGYSGINGEKLTKLTAQLPKHVGGGRDIGTPLRDYFQETWEADIFYCNRFLIDTGIFTHFRVNRDETWDGQAVDGTYRVHVDDIEPVECDWSVKPRMLTVDIEVLSPDGFPEPEDAAQPITAITAHDNYADEYTLWIRTNDTWDMDETAVKNEIIAKAPDTISLDEHECVVNIADIRCFANGTQLLSDFHQYVSTKEPDLLSGWNSSCTDNGDAFDYPYLIHRSKRLNVYGYEDWSPLGQVWTTRRGTGELQPGAKGVGFFDMLQAYKKTRWSEPKGGYGLANISQLELPTDATKMDIDTAVDADESDANAIDYAWQYAVGTFASYNLRDVQAVRAIDQTSGVTDLYQNLRTLAGTQFSDCHNNIDLIDMLVLRYAREHDLILPTNEEPSQDWFYGGHVFEPALGRHENVAYPDVWSMYPNMIRNVNMSPETLVGTASDLADSSYTEDDCCWTYVDTRRVDVKKESEPEPEKLYFLDPSVKKGFLPTVVDTLMDLKDAYDGTELYDAVKRVVNSCFTPDTEVLTPNGLQQITEIDIGDEVYAMDEQTGEMKVKPVINTIEKPDYTGELVAIENSRMDFTVTPDHDMTVKNVKYDDEYDIVEAGELNEWARYEVPTSWNFTDNGDGIEEYSLWEYADYVYVEPSEHGSTFRAKCPCEFERHKTGTYNGYEITVADFREHEGEIREMADRVLCRKVGRERRVPAYIDGNIFTQLAGWYITAGSISHTTSETVVLSQQNEEGCKIIQSMLDRSALRYYRYETGFRITSDVLSSCLTDLFGEGAYAKNIPRHFREQLSDFQKQLLTVTLIGGDGRNDDKTNARYTTASQKLRDDVLSLFTECGHIARYESYESNGHTGWRVYWHRDATHQFSMQRNGSTTTMESFEETHGESGVYCITVADNHTIIAGRNGKLSTTRQCFGVFGDANSYNKGYRLFDWRLAEGITLGGQRMIQDSAEQFVATLNEIKDERGYDGQKAYLVGGDTDSVMSSIPYVEETDEVIDIATTAAQRTNEWYDDWTTATFNIDEHYCELEIETIASRTFIPKGITKEKAKKRYAENIIWDEGAECTNDPPTWLTDRYDNPDDGEFAVTGIDVVRSDRAVVTRDVITKVLQAILRIPDRADAKSVVYEIISETVTAIEDGEKSLSYIARPKGMSNHPDEYGTPSRTPMPTYRGAKYVHEHFAWEDMVRADKPQLLYIDRVRGDYPSQYTAQTAEDGDPVDAIAVTEPDKVPAEFVIDTEKMIQKTLADPLEPILEPLHWSFADARADSMQSDISEFM